VGFTLNMRPKITGEKEDQVSLNLEVASNRLVDRQRVFVEDLLGIPNVTRRRFVARPASRTTGRSSSAASSRTRTPSR